MNNTATRHLLTDNEAEHRFAALAGCFDARTFATLSSLGVTSGWRCWKVGAGGLSIPRWLADRVGPAGEVVATDIDTTWLSSAPASVEVRVHDVSTEPPPDADFDLVHARLLLADLPGRDRALRSMVDALSPGGWLVVEDFDVAMSPTACLDPRTEDERRANRIRAGLIALLAERGADLHLGRTLPRRLRELGLVDVHAEASFPIAEPAARVLERANTAQVADALVAGGHATAADIEDHLAVVGTLDIATPPLVTVLGRRPRPDDDQTARGPAGEQVVPGGGIVAIRPPDGIFDRDRLERFIGVSDATSGARSLSMQLVVVPPGAHATPHFHPLHETVVYILHGEVEVQSGPNLEHRHACRTGDFVLTPAGVVHAPRNCSSTEPAYLIAARNDPSEHEQTVTSAPA